MADADGPTLRALLARRGLDLRLLVGGDLDAPVRWVHSSDLADPTPFLSEGLALLTTGTQFDPGAPAEMHDAYVARLAARGVVALGFGTEVVRDGVPAALVEAATAHGMPLFEVPYRTPFLAVARANAEAVAAAAYARRTWALAAQRAISLAALRPDGLHATVVELARQLGAWVGLYDAGGVLTHEAGALDAEVRADLDARVRVHLHRDQGGGASFDAGAVRVGLQTLGRGGSLRGVLAMAGPAPDAEARGVVNAVAALAGLALGQSVALRRARGELRSAALRALSDGDPALAERVATAVGGLPRGEVVVAVVDDRDAPREAVDEWLEARGSRVLAGRLDGDLVLVAREAEVVDELADEFAVSVGVAGPARLEGFAEALAQAGSARRGRGVRRFLASPVLAAGSTDEARRRATALLAPLVEHDRHHASDLVGTLRVWLEEDAVGEATASRLGVHRHTVRARIAAIERVLGRPLAAFPTRAELWVALTLTA